MRFLTPVLTALVVALILIGIWYLARSTKLGGREVDPRRAESVEEPSAEAGRDARGRIVKAFDWKSIAPDWVDGAGVPIARRETPGDLPSVVPELAGACWGRTPLSANTLRTKTLVSQLIADLETMSDEDKRRLAEFLRETDQPALRHWIIRAIRAGSGEPFVDAVAATYDSDPELVAETLQYMVPRAPRAAAALEDLYRRTLDPVERESLLLRMAFTGAPAAEEPLTRIFGEAADSPERRAALIGLARIGTPSARDTVWKVVEGGYEEALYDPASAGPDTESRRDLRAHAVAGLLASGDDATLDRLWGRLETAGDDDAVGGYVAEFLPLVRSPHLVSRAVDRMVRRGAVDAQLLSYVAARATTAEADQVARLLQLELAPDTREAITRVVGSLR
ncbi:MAG: hypothetical protein R3F20_04620 [Planctomycetota bacterium]